MDRPNFIAGLFSLAIAFFFFYQTFDFPTVQTNEVGPSFMPRIYASVLALLGFIMLIQSFRNREENQSTKHKTVMTWVAMALMLICLFLIPLLGFYSSTILFIIALLLTLKVRRIALLILVPASVSLFIFFFFQKLLKVPIPSGWLF